MKKRVQFKRIDDVVRGYVKEGITSYESINLPNSNPGVKMGIRFKLATLYIIFDTVEGFYYFGKKSTHYFKKYSLISNIFLKMYQYFINFCLLSIHL